MGLTIYYSLQVDTTSRVKARKLVKQLRQKALKIPFKSVGDVIENHGRDADFEQREYQDPERLMLAQARQYVVGLFSHFAPESVIMFRTDPGDGAESAHFGLARYPDSVQTEFGRQIKTELSGWSWAAQCMTEYSNAPACGGVENFLRCHMTVIRLLDAADDLGILQEVEDEGGYWQNRDIDSLKRKGGDWRKNRLGFVSDMIRYCGLDFGPGALERLERAWRDK